jgi:hypothetical protein
MSSSSSSSSSYAYKTTFLLLEVDTNPSWPSYTLPPSLALDPSRPARILIASHSSATPRSDLAQGDSPTDHRELQVQIPVIYDKSEYYHTAYALVDDDVAMLLGRDALGQPRKLASFLFEAASPFSLPSPGNPVSVSLSRRSQPVLSISASVGSALSCASPSISNPFSNLLQITTQAPLPAMPGIPNPINSVFIRTDASAEMQACYALDGAKVFLPRNEEEEAGVHEPIADLFPETQDGTLVVKAASLVTASVGHVDDATPSLAGAVPTRIADFMYFKNTYLYKYGGAAVRREGQVDPDPASKYEWQNGRFVWFEVNVVKDNVQKLIPKGTSLAGDGATVFAAWYPTAMLNKEAGIRAVEDDNMPYHEMGIRVAIKQEGKDEIYWHVVYILVDDDVALLLGRDMLGTPKKMADFSFNDADTFPSPGGTADFNISRRGIQVMKFEGIVGSKQLTTHVVPGLTDDNVTDVSVFAAQFPLHFDDDNKEGEPLLVQWTGGWEMLESRRVVGGSVEFSCDKEEPLCEFFESGPVVQAGALRWNYGLSADLRSRPTVGRISDVEEAEQYWRDTYQVKYGGKP